MNEKILKLTSAELVVMLRENSVKVFPVGIDDPFAGLSKTNRTKLELEVEDSLNNKGMRIRRFGGRFKYSDDALKLVKILTDFSRCVDVSFRTCGNHQALHNCYYLYEGEWTELSEGEGENSYIVSPIGSEGILTILKRLPSSACNTHYFIKMRKLDLKKAARLIERGKLAEEAELLNQTGADTRSIELMHRALMQETDFTILTLILNEEGNMEIKSAAILTSGEDSVELFTEIAADDRTMAGFKNADRGKYPELLEVLHKWLTV